MCIFSEDSVIPEVSINYDFYFKIRVKIETVTKVLYRHSATANSITLVI